VGLNGPPPNPGLHPFWNPEFFGDVIVVNGKTWPYLEVKPRRYRFRFLDGSNARFYRLTLAGSGCKIPAFWVIGSDGGLLDKRQASACGRAGGTGRGPGYRALYRTGWGVPSTQ
jgi:spore coat protein A